MGLLLTTLVGGIVLILAVIAIYYGVSFLVLKIVSGLFPLRGRRRR
jgi:hypothetical protein